MEFIYDVQGKLRTNITWRSHDTAEGAALTVYNYNAYSGFLTNKNDSDGKGFMLVYNTFNGQAFGHVGTRISARGTSTTYGYSWAGEVNSVSYSPVSIATATYTYDRLGRPATVAQGGMTTAFAYNDANRLES